jgi:hypothetical protein
MHDASGFVDMTSYEAQAREDAALLVRFEWMDVVDVDATKTNGYTTYKQKEFVRIRIPGSHEERVLKVKDEHKRRFPRAWAAFKAGDANAINGTALKECPLLNATEVSMLNHHSVVSVEQLAALSDENISGMGHGVRLLKERVKPWHEARKSAKPMAELRAELEEERQKRQSLEERLAALEAGSHGNGATGPQTPVKEPPKKRNRKPKTVPAES